MSSDPPPKDRIPLPRSIPGDAGALDGLLAKGGALARRWKGFQPREAQLRMFRETLRAFRQNDTTEIEAGTGTGKTLAYLLPAIISGKRTVISTGMKNLQDQIFFKDLNFVRAHFECSFKAAILKGRSSYVCMRGLSAVMRLEKRHATDPARAGKFRSLREWRAGTVAGEISELPQGFTSEKPFDRLPSSRESCMGRSCPFSKAGCFLARSREKAADADIILVNHSLLMASIAVASTALASGADAQDKAAEVIPQWDAAVIDEAHLLEQAAVGCFTRRLSTGELLVLFEELHGILDARLDELADRGEGPQSPEVAAVMSLMSTAEGMQGTVVRVASQLQAPPAAGAEEEHSSGELLWPDPLAEGSAKWSVRKIETRQTIRNLLAELGTDILDLDRAVSEALPKGLEDLAPISWKLRESADVIASIAGPPTPGYVYTLSAARNDAVLSAVPVDVSGFLRRALFDFTKTVVLTSATMATGGKFDYFNSRLGLDRRVIPLVLKSPFDFRSRTVLYVPASMPPFDEREPDGKYRPALEEEIARLLEVTSGRALVLFTARSRMDWVHGRLSGRRLPWTLLKQGEDSRQRLLERFRKDTGSVLMATMSFWHGVDVPGASLSAVIIDKLPFPVPSDPVHQARCRLLDGGDPNSWKGFNLLSVPAMEIMLKQGVGRLVRSADDWGVMAILDPRIKTKWYGRGFLSSPQIGHVTRDMAEVSKLFAEMEGPAKPRN
ncbi:MAG: ATP-dependent DNA helicase [Deltaproteobacteria bacterium]|jgi:ATP-dependent DNA helicase DinG|nr:ATP-dependent DNA helicase [Deltaproteobacteria bacterium]